MTIRKEQPPMTDDDRVTISSAANLPRKLSAAAPGLAGCAANLVVCTWVLSQGFHPQAGLEPDMPPSGSVILIAEKALPAVSTTATNTSFSIFTPRK
jgi:hypothetical protein